MIAVLLLFLLGGNVYTLLCQPWNNGELLKVTKIKACKAKEDAICTVHIFISRLRLLSTVH